MKTKTSTNQDVKYTLQCITKGNTMKLETISLTNEELLTISKYFKQEIMDLKKFNSTDSTSKELKDIEKQIEILRDIRVKIAMIRYK
jgi:hypothetical protein